MLSCTHHPFVKSQSRQQGSFLLEALVAILIVALGILGLMGLQARSIQNIDDAQFRSEAAFLATALISQMWVADPATLSAQFSTGGGAVTEYGKFKSLVETRLPGASIAGNEPTVTITLPAAIPAVQSSLVEITIFWEPPGGPTGATVLGLQKHQHQATATIGLN